MDRRTADEGDDATGLPVELVTLPGLEWVVEAGRVRRTGTFETATPVPGTPTAVEGVAEIDGRVTVVVDAAALLAGATRAPGADGPPDELVVLDRGGARPIALRTSPGVDVSIVPATGIAPPTALEGDLPEPSLVRAVVHEAPALETPRYVLDVDAAAAAIEG